MKEEILNQIMDIVITTAQMQGGVCGAQELGEDSSDLDAK